MDDAARTLTDLGLTPLEAEVYSHLAHGAVGTGYGIAKALGKPRANVYQALRTLQLKGAVIADDGATQRCRAVPPGELLDRLEREFKSRRARAEVELSRLPGPGADARVYRLESRAQVLERCRRVLAGASQVAVVDAFPEPLAALTPDLEELAARGVLVAVKAYAPCEIRGARVWMEPRAERVRRRWPADWVNVVADGSEVVLALLERGGDGVVQAVWSASPYLSYIVYTYLTQEVIVTAVDGALAAGGDLGELGSFYREARELMPIDIPGYRRLLRQIASPDAAPEPDPDPPSRTRRTTDDG